MHVGPAASGILELLGAEAVLVHLPEGVARSKWARRNEELSRRLHLDDDHLFESAFEDLLDAATNDVGKNVFREGKVPGSDDIRQHELELERRIVVVARPLVKLVNGRLRKASDVLSGAKIVVLAVGLP